MTSQLVGNDIKYPSAMGLFIRLTYKGESKETMFQLSEGEAGMLALVPMSGSRPAIELKQDNGELRIEDTSLFEEGEEVVNSRLQGLSEGYLDAKNQGIEVTSEETEEEEPVESEEETEEEKKDFLDVYSSWQKDGYHNNDDTDELPEFLTGKHRTIE